MGRQWTEKEIEYLKRNKKNLSYKELAHNLNKSVESVKHKCYELGIQDKKESKSRPWTEEEVSYLNRVYFRKSQSYIANKLDRSVYSIKRKADSLGLMAHSGEWISYKTLCRCFNVNMRVVHRWHDKFDMPSSKTVRGCITYYRIDTDEFWKWAESHKDIIPWNSYEELSLVPEPGFVHKEVLESSKTRNHRKPITEHLKSQVRHDRNMGISIPELASKYHRTKDSIRHILRSKPY
jgi:hypothetical protein